MYRCYFKAVALDIRLYIILSIYLLTNTNTPAYADLVSPRDQAAELGIFTQTLAISGSVVKARTTRGKSGCLTWRGAGVSMGVVKDGRVGL